MDRLHKYFEVYVSTETCNLRCGYCYIAQKRLFNRRVAKYAHSASEIAKVLSKERLGGVCFFNFCAGGETLISDEIIPILAALVAEGHYVSVVTNLTLAQRVHQLCNLPKEVQSHIFVKCSFHYLELKRLNLLEEYAANISLLDKSAISYTIELTPCDELIPFIDEVKSFCMDNFGVLCHVTVARDDKSKDLHHLSKLSLEEYKRIWGSFSSPLFDFKMKLIYEPRNEFCHAGEWSGYIDLDSGNVRPCYGGDIFANIYENVDTPLPEHAINRCPFPYCYNGHALLAFGLIPEYNAPTYISMRDRINKHGNHWIKDNIKAIFTQRVSNRQLESIRRSNTK